MNAAIVFEPESFSLDADRIMGCQSAGAGFLRAAVAGRDGGKLWAVTPKWQSAEALNRLVTAIDPGAETGWIPPDRPDMLAEVGTVYLPGPDIAEQAFLRLRHGAGAYSLVGVTYTLATHRAMDAVTRLVTAPVMPWDALVCASTAAKSVVEALVGEQAGYLNWRFGAEDFLLPKLPVIPFGVHCRDFQNDAEAGPRARQTLGIAPEAVVVLYFGRLNFHAKAHPHALFAGLDAAAGRCGKPVVLLMCGIFPHASIEETMREGAARFAPRVRTLFLDGHDAGAVKRSFACADLFVSLADNIQETFGLAPLEAMAAGLPVVVSDWDGYRDTVRDEVDGFRIPTWMPAAPLGEHCAARYRTGMLGYDRYVGLVCQHVSVDHDMLAARLDALIADPGLRRAMGESGRSRARAVYDWSVIFGRYQELWADLADSRRQASHRLLRQPRPVPHRHDPFQVFASLPTRQIRPTTKVRLRDGAPDWEGLLAHPLFAYARETLPGLELASRLVALLDGEEAVSMEELAGRAGLPAGAVMAAVSCLAKAGLVRLEAPYSGGGHAPRV